MDPTLIYLENRLEVLERILIGDSVIPENFEPCINQLDAVSKRVKKVSENRPKIGKIVSRVKEIEKYMDPTFFDDISLSNNDKMEIILADEENIRQMANDLEQLTKLKEILTSQHLKDSGVLQRKFRDLSAAHIETKNESENFNENVQNLLKEYTELMENMSLVVLDWNQKLVSREKENS